MSEKLYMQWKDFKESVNSAFGKLRGKKEFTDITLVFEDGQQVEAHKVILARVELRSGVELRSPRVRTCIQKICQFSSSDIC